MIPTLYVGDHILVNSSYFGLPIPFSTRKSTSSANQARRRDRLQVPAGHIERLHQAGASACPRPRSRRAQRTVHQRRIGAEGKAGTSRYEDPRASTRQELYIENIGGKNHQLLYDLDTLRFCDTAKKVPPVHYFCIVDNRDHSKQPLLGFVPFEHDQWASDEHQLLLAAGAAHPPIGSLVR
jgi:signal peptidase I